jgi:glycosyltransferase involved in cell wall biosynthesis
MKNEKLKILIISDSVPYPLSSGGKVCTFNFIDYLKSRHDFTLIFPVYSEESIQNKEKLAKIWPQVNLIGVEIFTDRYSSKSSWVKNRLRFFRSVVSNFGRKKSNNAPLLYSRKLDFTESFKPVRPEFVLELRKLVINNDFDIIQVQYTHNLNLVEVLPKSSYKIFEQIESQFDVLRDFAITMKMNAEYVDYLKRNCESLENFYIGKYDAVFTLNESDKIYLELNTSKTKIFNSPFGVLSTDIADNPNFNITPSKLIFSGNEAHHPNYDALEWYLKNVHEKVFLKQKLILHVTGNWSNAAIKYFKTLSSKVIFEGFVEDYTVFLKGGIVIVPIRIGGGGLRTKTLYAMANGVPVVTTTIGSFGIEGKDQQHFLLADSPTDFELAIESLILNNEKSTKISKEAFNLIQQKYSQTVTAELRNSYYLELLKTREDEN